MRQAEIYARRCLQIAGILVHPPSVMPTPHLFSVAMFPTHRIPLQLLPRCAKDEKSAKTASRWRHFESRLSFEQERRRQHAIRGWPSALVRFPYLGCACHVLSLHIFGLIIIIICIYIIVLVCVRAEWSAGRKGETVDIPITNHRRQPTAKVPSLISATITSET